jgi:hypothetical protein
VPGYIVHHKVLLTPSNINDPNTTLNHDKLEHVCVECHNREHMGYAAIRQDVMFDGEGNLIKKNE